MLSIHDPRIEPYLREFARQSGIDYRSLRAMQPGDLHRLMVAWSRSNVLAEQERRLLAAPDVVRPTSDHAATAFTVALWAAVVVAAFVICSGIWRFLT